MLPCQRVPEPDEPAVRSQHLPLPVVPAPDALLRAVHEKVQNSPLQSRQLSQFNHGVRRGIGRRRGGRFRVLSHFRDNFRGVPAG